MPLEGSDSETNAIIEKNREAIEELKENTREGGSTLIPYIGAGLSVSFGYPTWSSFLLHCSSRTETKEHVATLLDQSEYEQAAELLMQIQGEEFICSIQETFGKKDLGLRWSTSPLLILPYLIDGPIMTTNFDPVLEEVFEYHRKRLRPVVWGAKPDAFRQALKDRLPALLKLHGDAFDRIDRTLTLTDYQRNYEGSAQLVSVLKEIFTTSTVLFIGCSLQSDRVMDVLKLSTTSKKHFAILASPTEESRLAERNNFLSARNIRPIWYPNGRHDLIGNVIGALIKTTNPSHPILEISRLKEDSYVSTIRAAETFLASRPGDPLVTHTLSMAYIVQSADLATSGDFNRGIESSDKAIRVWGPLKEAEAVRFFRGHMYFAKGEYDLSLQDLAAAHAEFERQYAADSSPRVKFMVAESCAAHGIAEFALKHWREAIPLFERAIGLVTTKDSLAQNLLYQRFCYYAQGDRDWALARLEETLRDDPDAKGARVLYASIKREGVWSFKNKMLAKRLRSLSYGPMAKLGLWLRKPRK